MKLYVDKPVCEYKTNPIGIDVRSPRLSWRIAGEGANVRQAAYRIQVAFDPDFRNEIVWDTDRVDSDRSVHIVYQGAALESRTRYHYRIKIWASSGDETDWSAPAFWETGLLGPGEWGAAWISANLHPRKDEPCHYLRGTLALAGGVRRARAYATALGMYYLYVNGCRAGDELFAPGWTSYAHRLQYQTYDVTPLLRKGDNAIGLLLGDGWYRSDMMSAPDRDHTGDYLAALVQVHVEYEDGREVSFGSGPGWTAFPSPVRMSQIYAGETFDAGLALPGWNEAGYDDRDWHPAELPDVSKERLVAQENLPVRVVEELRPVRVFTTPAGETVLDMGQNMVGWIRFEVEGEAGTTVTLQHAEVLDHHGNFYNKNLRTAYQKVTYTCRGGGVEAYEPHFTFQGFRYVKVEGYPGRVDPAKFTGRVIHTDLEATGAFECSDELVNRLQRNIVWSQKGNFLDVPTDCPQRNERLGWLGDAQVFARTAAFNMNIAPFFGKWLKDFKVEQRKDGGMPPVVPNTLGDRFYSSSAWGDAAVICPWLMYVCYGDTRILSEHYDSMKAWVEYIRKQGDNEFLWNSGFHFGDWLALDAPGASYVGATPSDLIATAFYAYSTELLIRAAGLLGREDDVREYRALHDGIRTQFRHEFVTPGGRLASPTQTAQVLPLAFRLLERKEAERALQTLIRLIAEKNGHLTTGFLGTPYLNHVLSDNGCDELAYRLLLQRNYPSWLYEVTMGATTIWEHWDGLKPDGSIADYDMNSFNQYALGAIGDWLYRAVAGIDTDEAQPGYKKIRLAPRPDPQWELTYAAASLQSMYGEIRSSWRLDKERNRITLEVAIPHNATASVRLPFSLGLSASGCSVNGESLADSQAILALARTPDGIEAEVGSGMYRFEYVPSEGRNNSFQM